MQMSLIKRNVLLSALAGATLLIASTAAQAEMVLHRGNGAEPETLDPAKSTGVTESNIQYELLEGLTTYSVDGLVVPGVAEKVGRERRRQDLYFPSARFQMVERRPGDRSGLRLFLAASR
jgi:ABC-type oligopeptide transport system substrate-binding subunit